MPADEPAAAGGERSDAAEVRRTRREAKACGWLLIAGGLLFTGALLCVGLASQDLPTSVSLLEWAGRHRGALALADEGLAFAVAGYTVALVLLYRRLRQRSPIASLVGVVVHGVGAVGFVSATLALGRLVYPVSTVSVSEQGALLSAAQVFGGIHFAAIALGASIVAFGVALGGRPMIGLSLAVGVLQVAGSYFAGTTPVWLLATALVSWLLWSMVVGRLVLAGRAGRPAGVRSRLWSGDPEGAARGGG
ncbi:MAG: hypothetical protein QM582_15360 [Micropruina sp.]|uniref:hypothetical protein n=1 Tax=Micropruina sp. TaxID=2737536 RepID=UPI0039E2C2AC